MRMCTKCFVAYESLGSLIGDTDLRDDININMLTQCIFLAWRFWYSWMDLCDLRVRGKQNGQRCTALGFG